MPNKGDTIVTQTRTMACLAEIWITNGGVIKTKRLLKGRPIYYPQLGL